MKIDNIVVHHTRFLLLPGKTAMSQDWKYQTKTGHKAVC